MVIASVFILRRHRLQIRALPLTSCCFGDSSLALDFVRVGGNLVGDSWSVECGSEESEKQLSNAYYYFYHTAYF